MGDEQDVSAVSGLLDVVPFSGGCDLDSGEDVAAEGEQGFVEGGAFGGLVGRFVFFPRRSCFDHGVEGVLVHGRNLVCRAWVFACEALFGLLNVGVGGGRGQAHALVVVADGGEDGSESCDFGSGVGPFGEVYGDRFLVCW